MVRRLWKEWRNGGNRFALPGEALFGAFRGEALVGVCGLNRDPYGGRAEVGRVRHLYVARAERRQGLGRALLQAVIAAAERHFTRLELWTLSPEAAALFRALRFEEAGDDLFATHRRLLSRASASSPASRPPSPRACGG